MKVASTAEWRESRLCAQNRATAVLSSKAAGISQLMEPTSTTPPATITSRTSTLPFAPLDEENKCPKRPPPPVAVVVVVVLPSPPPPSTPPPPFSTRMERAAVLSPPLVRRRRAWWTLKSTVAANKAKASTTTAKRAHAESGSWLDVTLVFSSSSWYLYSTSMPTTTAVKGLAHKLNHTHASAKSTRRSSMLTPAPRRPLSPTAMNAKGMTKSKGMHARSAALKLPPPPLPSSSLPCAKELKMKSMSAPTMGGLAMASLDAASEVATPATPALRKLSKVTTQFW
mmetsp:Transcript_38932/g.78533  ORF Transcript_38932/g.78533 Transcript_38932/m.78533 type:complete len:284 (-) Transcript_38932:1009-1860(-)